VELLPVHIGVLTIADEHASAELATAAAIDERATAAGHKIVDEEVVADNEAAIRDQLVRWISHDNIDVVIVAAAVESEAATAALAPLIMQTLPGFTDLFRWLTFQEIGASAMLSAAEAAQCQGTFVFVLPAHEGAVRAAMDKLILPQLDIRTKPKNLVAQMPRLRDAAKKLVPDKSQPLPVTRATPSGPIARVTPGGVPAQSPAVPVPVSSRPDTEPNAVPVPVDSATDKTQGGAGLPPKLPARSKPRTANTIARRSADDPPTKPIDLAKLEKQIELSTQNDAQTKQIDLQGDAKTKVVDMSAHQAKTRVVDSSRLPRLPPGADEKTIEDDEALTFTAPPRANSSGRSPSPLASAKAPVAQIPSVRQGAATPGFSPPVARSAVATPPLGTPVRDEVKTPPVATPTVTIPSRTATPARGVAPPPRMTAVGAAVAQPPAAPTQSIPTVRSTQATPVVPPPAPPARVTTATPAAPPAVTIAPRQRPPTPPPPPAGAMRGMKRPTAPIQDEAPTIPAGRPLPIDDEAVTTRAASATPVMPAPVVNEEAATTRGELQAAVPQPNAAEIWPRSIASSEPAREPPASAAQASSSFAAEPARVRTPTPPPPARHDPLAVVTSNPISVVDLPHGDFVYPILKPTRKSGAAIKVLLALAALAAGFFAFIKLYPLATQRSDETAAVAPPPPSETPPAPIAEVTVPETAKSEEPVSEQPKPEQPAPEQPKPEEPRPEDIEIDPVVDTPAPKQPTTKPRIRKPRQGSGAVTAPATEPTDTTEPVTKPEVTEVKQPDPPSDPSCDEVSCVLSKYDRPCCARYKPADGFTPKNVTPDGLDRTMVKSGVEKIKPKVVACGEKAGIKGTVRVAVVVEPDGSVKSADVTESPDSALGECVAAAMRRAKFGKSINGGDFTYPFAF
jgi:molybdenum cofactor biosynthesis protein B